ncbi:MFS transporter [Streptomyces sp. NBC_01185]|uniref:MFS transporter n=1 Tax=Streptomyces sp. NBC_01185 TaxID=2903764 RepID=UPI003864022C
MARTTRGELFSAFSWSYLIAQIPGGWLLDRFGSKKVHGIALFLWSLFTMAQGPSASSPMPRSC